MVGSQPPTTLPLSACSPNLGGGQGGPRASEGSFSSRWSVWPSPGLAQVGLCRVTASSWVALTLCLLLLPCGLEAPAPGLPTPESLPASAGRQAKSCPWVPMATPHTAPREHFTPHFAHSFVGIFDRTFWQKKLVSVYIVFIVCLVL